MKIQIKKFLSLVLVAVMCLSTFAIGASAADACAHTNKQFTESKKATCEEYGYDSYKCSDCGKDFVENIVKPLGHNLKQTGETIPATCFREEATVWECANEGCDVREERGNLTGEQCEDFTEPTFAVVDGKLQGSMTCKDCGYVHTTKCECGVTHEELVVTEGHSHEVEDMIADATTIVRPTCTANGSIVYKCDDCKYTFTVVIEKTHQLVFHEEKAATCTTNGTKAHYTCELCDVILDDKKAETTAAALVIAAAHNIKPVDTNANTAGVQYDFVVEENCVIGQYATYKVYCTECDYTDKVTATEFTHEFRADDKSYDATCAIWGDHVKVCALCGLDKSEAIPPKGFVISLGADKKLGTADDVVATYAELFTNEEYIKLATKVDAVCGGYAKYVYTLYTKCSEKGCTFCENGTLTIEYGEKKDHVFAESKDSAPKAPTCTETGTKALYVCECGAIDPKNDGSEIPAAGHTWSKEYLYCSAEKQFRKVCTVCEEVTTLTEDELKKAVAPEGESHVRVTYSVMLPTCVEDGEKVTYCTICHHIDAPQVLPATGHAIDKEKDTATVIPGTCTEKAMYIYECKNGCGHNEFVYGDYDKTPAGHMAAMEKANNVDVPTVLREATCTVKSLLEYTCTQCETIYTVTGDYGHVVTDEVVDPICATQTNGKSGKWCNTCSKWVGEPAIIPYEHNEDGVCAAQSVCGNDYGWAEYKYCTACEAYELAAKAAAVAAGKTTWTKAIKSMLTVRATVQVKGHETDTKTSAKIPATCTTVGVKEFKYCAVCEDKDAVIASAKGSSSYTWKGTKLQIAKLTHMAGSRVEATADCVKDGFTLTYCNNCSEALVVNFDYANGHVWDNAEGKEISFNLDDKATDYDCTKDGYKYYACKLCDAKKEIDGTRVKAHHVDADGKAFTSSCTSINKTTTCIHGCVVEVEHDYNTVDKKAPTCTAEGWEINICADCGERENTVIYDSLETYLKKMLGEDYDFETVHAILYVEEEDAWVYFVYDEEYDEWDIKDWGSIEYLAEEYEFVIVEDKCVESTHTTAGAFVFECPCCEKEITVALDKLTGIEMEITANNAIVPGASIVNGGIVEFTVALNVADLEASILKADFFYDAEILTFLEAKVEGIFNVTDAAGTLVIETNAVVTDPKVANGTVSVIVDASYTSNKLPVDVALNGNEIAFVTLKFRVAADAKGEASLSGIVTEVANVEGDMFVNVNAAAVQEYFVLAEAFEVLYNEYIQAMSEYYVALEGGIEEIIAAAAEALAEAEAALTAFELEANEWLEETFVIPELLEYMVEAYVNSLAEVEFEIAKLGNINGDSSINTVDVLAIRQMAFTIMDGTIVEGEYALPNYLAEADDEGNYPMVEVNYLAEADINMDGIVGLEDYALLQQYLVGNITYTELVLTSQVTE